MLPIGGYFELERACGSGVMHDQMLAYQSARASLYHLLEGHEIECLWLPRYLCDSVIEVVECLGVNYQLYSVDEMFGIATTISLGEKDYIFYVNYFGLNDAAEEQFLAKYPSHQVILDYSQNFFKRPNRKVFATIYSPRKFLGVPDGGLLSTAKSLAYDQLPVDDASIGRCEHLLRRLNGEVSSGYIAYQYAEESLREFEPKKMSKLTHRLLASLDYEYVRRQRQRNFIFLHEQLGRFNRLGFELKDQVPMCYPLLTNSTQLRSRLIERDIFIPCYWPEVIKRQGVSEFEQDLVQHLVAIPCDQRCTLSQLEFVVDSIQEIQNEY